METLRKDLLHAWRQLWRQRLTAAVVILTLGVGIGGVTTVYSFIRHILLVSQSADDPERVVMVWTISRAEGGGRSLVSVPDFLDWRRDAASFEQLAALSAGGCTLGTGRDATPLPCARVSGGFFEALGARPARGRALSSTLAAQPEPEVVLSDSAWRRRFGADPALLGRTITVDGQVYGVVGIMPPRWTFPGSVELWLPLPLDAGRADRGERVLTAIGRLRPGVPSSQANAELATLAKRLSEDHRATNAGFGVDVATFRDEALDGQSLLVLGLLGGVVAFVLLIACTNVAHMLLAQAASRRKEFAVRAALGAVRGRLIRQLLVESALVGLLGGGLGLVFAAVLRGLLRARFAVSLPMLNDVALDARVLLFTLAASLATALVFGLAPALAASRLDLVEDLREGGRTPAATRRRARDLLVIGEVGLAVVLLILAGLMLQTLIAFQRVELGFRPERLLTFQLRAPEARYADPGRAAAAFEELRRELGTQPGIEGAASVSRLPLAGSKRNPTRTLEIEGRPLEAEAGDRPWAVDVTVSPSYFEVLGIPLRRGRTFGDGDSDGGQPVAVVSEAMAARYWPGAEAVGQRVRLGGADEGAWITVVGVVADVRNDDVDSPPVPQLYLPLAQHPRRQMGFLVRTAGDPVAWLGPVRGVVAAAGHDDAIHDIQTMEQVVRDDLEGTRILVAILALFAFGALGLAAAGIFGVVSHTVSQRTHEIGVRLALGALPRGVVSMIVTGAVTRALLGAGLGLLVGLAAARALASVLYGVGAQTVGVFAGSAALLALAALLASLVPAMRAARIDPNVALRCE